MWQILILIINPILVIFYCAFLAETQPTTLYTILFCLQKKTVKKPCEMLNGAQK